MDKTNLAEQFASRLRDAMVNAGFQSRRSTSGVCIHKLSEITGYSVQICRKYLRGEAIPEPTKLKELATKLDVAAGWLLFGDVSSEIKTTTENLLINKKILHYILVNATCLYQTTLKEHEIPDFLMELIHDVMSIQANEEQTKKIIDLAFASLKHFSQPKEK